MFIDTSVLSAIKSRGLVESYFVLGNGSLYHVPNSGITIVVIQEYGSGSSPKLYQPLLEKGADNEATDVGFTSEANGNHFYCSPTTYTRDNREQMMIVSSLRMFLPKPRSTDCEPSLNALTKAAKSPVGWRRDCSTSSPTFTTQSTPMPAAANSLLLTRSCLPLEPSARSARR